MSLTDLNSNHQAVLQHEARKHAGREREVLKVGAAVFNRQIGSGSPTAKRFAIEKALTAMRSFVRKSEADSVADAESHDFDIFPSTPTPGQAAAAETRTLQVQGLAQAATRRLQSWGVENPTDADYNRAIEDVLNVSITSYEGEDGQTRVDSNPALAARIRERGPDESIWMDMGAPSQLARPSLDVEQALAAATNFQGSRNAGYTGQRREMGTDTNFSGSGGNAPASGGPPRGSELDAQAIAAAFAAGVQAGQSNFAKRRGR